MLDVLDNFGFVEPVHGKKVKTIKISDNIEQIKGMEVCEVSLVKNTSIENTIKLNKNFYPDECSCGVIDGNRYFNDCKIHEFKFGEMKITIMNEEKFQELTKK